MNKEKNILVLFKQIMKIMKSNNNLKLILQIKVKNGIFIMKKNKVFNNKITMNINSIKIKLILMKKIMKKKIQCFHKDNLNKIIKMYLII